MYILDIRTQVLDHESLTRVTRVCHELSDCVTENVVPNRYPVNRIFPCVAREHVA